ncbi:MAG: glycosyltransferase [Spirochaetales bacterium]|nr:glycosyltransferase [Spirochaetales bacterium]
MTFTVLQSVYKKDNPEFLSQSLQSIADNSVQPACVVLVKDGVLTPELESVISEWKDKLPLKVVGYEKNQGLAHALNYGLQFVETELVARMDSDDICFPDRFEKQLAQFEADYSLEILGGGIEEFYIEENGTEFRRVRLYPKWTDSKSRTLYRGTPVAHPTLMMKTALLKEFRYSENTKCNEDIDLWFRILAAGNRIRTLQEPVLHFRITDGTFRRRSVSKALNEYSIYTKNLRHFNGVSKRDIIPLMRLAARFLPGNLNKKAYLSQKRQKLFKENLMNIKSLNNQVFMKNGHIFEAVIQFEENGIQMIKGVQLDSHSKCIVEVPAEEVELFKTSESVDVTLKVKD